MALEYIVIGAFLGVVRFTLWSALLSGLLFLVFIIGIASAWQRGLQIDCGCFGGGGQIADATSKYPLEIARDVGLLAASALLVWRPRTRLALDPVLFPTPTERSEEHTSELQSLMRTSYAVFSLKHK